MRLGVLHQYWYLAVQDGPYDKREFSTIEEANEAYKQLVADDKAKHWAPGVCVMSGTRLVRD